MRLLVGALCLVALTHAQTPQTCMSDLSGSHLTLSASSQTTANPASAAFTTGWCAKSAQKDEWLDIQFSPAMGVKSIIVGPKDNVTTSYPKDVLAQYMPIGATAVQGFPLPGGLVFKMDKSTTMTQSISVGLTMTKLRLILRDFEKDACMKIAIKGCPLDELCPTCIHGLCTHENNCQCAPGYLGAGCDKKACSPLDLGLSDGNVTSDKITVSSQVTGHSKEEIRLAENKTGWCPAASDPAPSVKVVLDKPMAVSVLKFQFPQRIEPEDKMFMRSFDLQYIAPQDSTGMFRTYAPDIPSLNNSHYFTVTLIPAVVTDTVLIKARDVEKRACFKMELGGCDPEGLCSPGWCLNGGKCIGDDACNCQSGWVGDRCDQKTTDIKAASAGFLNIVNNVLVTSSFNFSISGHVTLTYEKQVPVVFLNGSSSFIELKPGSVHIDCLNDINKCTSGFTFAIDVKFAKLVDNTYIISSGGDLPDHHGLALFYSQNTLTYIVTTTTFRWTLQVTYTPTLHTWHHVEITWNKHLGMELHIDGVLLGTVGRPAPTTTSKGATLCIGCSHTTTQVDISFSIKEFHTWSIDRTELVNAGLKPDRKGITLCIGCSHTTTQVDISFSIKEFHTWSIDRTELVNVGLKPAPTATPGPITTGLATTTTTLPPTTTTTVPPTTTTLPPTTTTVPPTTTTLPPTTTTTDAASTTPSKGYQEYNMTFINVVNNLLITPAFNFTLHGRPALELQTGGHTAINLDCSKHQYIELPDKGVPCLENINDCSKGFTFKLQIKFTSIDEKLKTYILSSGGDVETSSGMAIYIQSNQLVFGVKQSIWHWAGTYNMTSILKTQVWYKLEVSWSDSKGISVVMDGYEVISDNNPTPSPIVPSTNPVLIGKTAGANTTSCMKVRDLFTWTTHREVLVSSGILQNASTAVHSPAPTSASSTPVITTTTIRTTTQEKPPLEPYELTFTYIQNNVLFTREHAFAFQLNGNPTLSSLMGLKILTLHGSSGDNLQLTRTGVQCIDRFDKCNNGFTVEIGLTFLTIDSNKKTYIFSNNGHENGQTGVFLYYEGNQFTFGFGNGKQLWKSTLEYNIQLGPFYTFIVSWSGTNELVLYINYIQAQLTTTFTSVSTTTLPGMFTVGPAHGEFTDTSMNIGSIKIWKTSLQTLIQNSIILTPTTTVKTTTTSTPTTHTATTTNPSSNILATASYNLAFISVLGNTIFTPKFTFTTVGHPVVQTLDSGKKALKLDLTKGEYIRLVNQSVPCLSDLTNCTHGFTFHVSVNFIQIDVKEKLYILTNGGSTSGDGTFYLFYQNHHFYFGTTVGKLRWSAEVNYELTTNIFQTFELSWSTKFGIQLYVDGKLLQSSNQTSTIDTSATGGTQISIGKTSTNVSQSMLLITDMHFWSVSRQIIDIAHAQSTSAFTTTPTRAQSSSPTPNQPSSTDALTSTVAPTTGATPAPTSTVTSIGPGHTSERASTPAGSTSTPGVPSSSQPSTTDHILNLVKTSAYNLTFTSINGSLVLTPIYTFTVTGHPILKTLDSGKTALELRVSKGEYIQLSKHSIPCLTDLKDCSHGFTFHINVNVKHIESTEKVYIITNSGTSTDNGSLYLYYENKHLYFGIVVGHLKWSSKVKYELTTNIFQTLELTWSRTLGIQLYANGKLLKSSNTTTTVDKVTGIMSPISIGRTTGTTVNITSSVLQITDLHFWSVSRQIIETAHAITTKSVTTPVTEAPTSSISSKATVTPGQQATSDTSRSLSTSTSVHKVTESTSTVAPTASSVPSTAQVGSVSPSTSQHHTTMSKTSSTTSSKPLISTNVVASSSTSHPVTPAPAISTDSSTSFQHTDSMTTSSTDSLSTQAPGVSTTAIVTDKVQSYNLSFINITGNTILTQSFTFTIHGSISLISLTSGEKAIQINSSNGEYVELKNQTLPCITEIKSCSKGITVQLRVNFITITYLQKIYILTSNVNTPSSTEGIYLYYYNHTMYFGFAFKSVLYHGQVNYVITTNKWYGFEVTWSETYGVALYINGNLIKASKETTEITQTVAPTSIIIGKNTNINISILISNIVIVQAVRDKSDHTTTGSSMLSTNAQTAASTSEMLETSTLNIDLTTQATKTTTSNTNIDLTTQATKTTKANTNVDLTTQATKTTKANTNVDLTTQATKTTKANTNIDLTTQATKTTKANTNVDQTTQATKTTKANTNIDLTTQATKTTTSNTNIDLTTQATKTTKANTNIDQTTQAAKTTKANSNTDQTTQSMKTTKANTNIDLTTQATKTTNANTDIYQTTQAAKTTNANTNNAQTTQSTSDKPSTKTTKANTNINQTTQVTKTTTANTNIDQTTQAAKTTKANTNIDITTQATSGKTSTKTTKANSNTDQTTQAAKTTKANTNIDQTTQATKTTTSNTNVDQTTQATKTTNANTNIAQTTQSTSDKTSTKTTNANTNTDQTTQAGKTTKAHSNTDQTSQAVKTTKANTNTDQTTQTTKTTTSNTNIDLTTQATKTTKAHSNTDQTSQAVKTTKANTNTDQTTQTTKTTTSNTNIDLTTQATKTTNANTNIDQTTQATKTTTSNSNTDQTTHAAKTTKVNTNIDQTTQATKTTKANTNIAQTTQSTSDKTSTKTTKDNGNTDQPTQSAKTTTNVNTNTDLTTQATKTTNTNTNQTTQATKTTNTNTNTDQTTQATKTTKANTNIAQTAQSTSDKTSTKTTKADSNTDQTTNAAKTTKTNTNIAQTTQSTSDKTSTKTTKANSNTDQTTQAAKTTKANGNIDHTTQATKTTKGNSNTDQTTQATKTTKTNTNIVQTTQSTSDKSSTKTTKANTNINQTTQATSNKSSTKGTTPNSNNLHTSSSTPTSIISKVSQTTSAQSGHVTTDSTEPTNSGIQTSALPTTTNIQTTDYPTTTTEKVSYQTYNLSFVNITHNLIYTHMFTIQTHGVLVLEKSTSGETVVRLNGTQGNFLEVTKQNISCIYTTENCKHGFTIQIKINFISIDITQKNYIFVSSGETPGTTGMYLYYQNNTFHFGTVFQHRLWSSNVVVSITENTWHTYELTWSLSHGLGLYIDGSLAQSTNVSTSTTPSLPSLPGSILIGKALGANYTASLLVTGLQFWSASRQVVYQVHTSTPTTKANTNIDLTTQAAKTTTANTNVDQTTQSTSDKSSTKTTTPNANGIHTSISSSAPTSTISKVSQTTSAQSGHVTTDSTTPTNSGVQTSALPTNISLQTTDYPTTTTEKVSYQTYNLSFVNITHNLIYTHMFTIQTHGVLVLEKHTSGETVVRLNGTQGNFLEVTKQNISCIYTTENCKHGFTIQIKINFLSIDITQKNYIFVSSGETPGTTGMYLYYQNNTFHFGTVFQHRLWSSNVVVSITENTWHTYELTWSLSHGLGLYIDGSLAQSTNVSTSTTPSLPSLPGSILIGQALGANYTASLLVTGLQFWSASRQVVYQAHTSTPEPSSTTAAPTTTTTDAPTTTTTVPTTTTTLPTTTTLTPIPTFTWNFTYTSQTNITVHGQVPIKDGGLTFTNSSTQFIDFGTSNLACLLNPLSCKDGFTIQFHIEFHRIEENTYLLTSGGQLPNGVGLAVIYRFNNIQFVLTTSTQSWFATCHRKEVLPNRPYSIMISWHLTLGLEVYVNNVLIDANKKPTDHVVTSVNVNHVYFGKQPTTVVTTGTSVKVDYVLHSLIVWYARLEILVDRGYCKPPIKPTAPPTTTKAPTTKPTMPPTTTRKPFTTAPPTKPTTRPQCPIGCSPISPKPTPPACPTQKPTPAPTKAPTTTPKKTPTTPNKPSPTTPKPPTSPSKNPPTTPSKKPTPPTKPTQTAAPPTPDTATPPTKTTTTTTERGPPNYVTVPKLEPIVDKNSKAQLECRFKAGGREVVFTVRLTVNGTVVDQKTTSGTTTNVMFSVAQIDMYLYQAKIQCSVQAKFVGGTHTTNFFISNTVTPRFTVTPGRIIVTEGKHSEFVTVTSTCPPQFYCCQGCKAECQVHIVGSFNFNHRIQQKCNRDYIAQSLIVSNKPPNYNEHICGFPLTVGNWEQNNKIEIKATIDNRRDGDHTNTLKIISHVYNQPANAQITVKPANSFQISAIQVTAKDNDASATCKSVNDPHLRTFDGTFYNNMREGVFVLYKHSTLPFEVRAVYRKCSKRGHATCNCAVAVQSGDDVITVMGCQGTTHPGQGHGIGLIMQQLFGGRHGELAKKPMTIQIYKNGDFTPGTIIRRFGCGQKYEIELPTGMIVTVQQSYKPFINIFIKGASSDRGQAQGLCGNFDGNRNNDLKPSTAAFINRWKSEYENFFTGVGVSSQQFSRTYCSCIQGQNKICIAGIGAMRCVSTRNVITDSLVKQAQRPILTAHGNGNNGHNNRHRRQADVEEELFEEVDIPEDEVLMTEEEARKRCIDEITNNDITSSCTPVLTAGSNTSLFIDNCVHDYNDTGNFVWAKDALRDIAVECADNINDFRAANESGNTNVTDGIEIPDQEQLQKILEKSCLDDCGEHGACVDTVCDCEEGYTGETCNISSKTTVPTLATVPVLCDMDRTADCQAAMVYGNNFVDTPDLTCHYEFVQVNEGVVLLGETGKVAATLISLNQVLCPLPRPQSARLTVSNDGAKPSTETSLQVVYNAVCHECLLDNNTLVATCARRQEENCIIGDVCYGSGDQRPGDQCQVCRPAANDTTWSRSLDTICLDRPQAVQKDTEDDAGKKTITIVLAVMCGVLAAIVVIGAICIFRKQSGSSSKTKEFGTYDVSPPPMLHRTEFEPVDNPGYSGDRL